MGCTSSGGQSLESARGVTNLAWGLSLENERGQSPEDDERLSNPNVNSIGLKGSCCVERFQSSQQQLSPR
jgi:hypothetical protein